MADSGNRGIEFRDRVYNAFVRETISWTIFAFCGLALIFLVAFLAAAVWSAAKSVGIFWGFGAEIDTSLYKTKALASIAHALKAVELILVAPLPYLFASAIGHYLLKIGDKDGDHQEIEKWQFAQNTVIGVKTFATSLLASIIAVDLVGRVIEKATLEIFDVLPQVAILLTMIIFLYVLEKHGEK